jgi:hypothetical protein
MVNRARSRRGQSCQRDLATEFTEASQVVKIISGEIEPPQGCRLATSVGGVLTGRGADIIIIIIIIDPLKPEEALSQAQRQTANE